jgi:hypothetical protein
MKRGNPANIEYVILQINEYVILQIFRTSNKFFDNYIFLILVAI